MLSFIFVKVCGLKTNLLFVYICIAVGDPINKKGRESINWFNPSLFLSQDQYFHWLISVICVMH